MGRDVAATVFTREDRQRYREKIRLCLDAFARMLRESQFDFECPLTGLEIELNIVDEDGDPAMLNAKVLDLIADPNFQTELGQFNIEINVAPRRLEDRGVMDFERSIRDSLNAAEAHAREAGGHLIMIGILPTIMEEHATVESLSANPRYALLNDQIFAARGEDLHLSITGPERLSTFADSVAPEAACTSV